MIGKLYAASNARGRTLLVRAVVLMVLTAVLQGAAFVVMVPLLEALFSGDVEAARPWIVGLAVGAVGYAAAFWLGSLIGQLCATEVVRSLHQRVGARLVQLPLGWFATDRSGEVADLATRSTVFTASSPYAILRPVIGAFLTPATVIVGVAFVDWRMSVTMLASTPLIWLAFRWTTRTVAVRDRALGKAIGDAASRVIEFARSQPALRAAGDGAIGRRLVDQALAEQHRVNRKLLVSGGTGIGVTGGVAQLALTAIIVVGTYLTLGGGLDVATLVSLLVLGVRFVEPITQASALGGGIRVAENTLDRILALEAEPTLPEPQRPAVRRGNDVVLDHVTFGYGGEPVLRDVSLTVPEGTMTAVVGPSGSGKTTLTRLVARFYDPESGTVSLGGVPLPELGSAEVLRAVAPVFQDVYLFDGTILDNILLGRPDATREEAVHAGTLARVDEIVERLPGGWDSRVGEGGTSLSGGERQRVSIARALLKDAPVVLLDEATAALDAGNESYVQQAFAAVRANHTLIVVAHRLQTIRHADQIVMLDGHGGIAEHGTHEELLAAGGPYASFWDERAATAGWRIGR